MDKVLTVLGRSFISAGVLVFLFVAYQLWGTNIAEAKSQDRLQKESSQLFPEPAGGGTTTTAAAPGETTAPTSAPGKNTTPAPPPAPSGEAVAMVKIPAINLSKAVVEGTDVNDLKKGPGHYIGTPLPGQPGNASLAGHRTTYGAPFNRIQELKNGDEIDVTTRQGSFRYRVSGQQVVDPSNVSVLNPTKDNRLTLTTCHPKYSAAQRLVITAKLDTSPAPAAAAEQTPTTVAPKGSTTTFAGATTTTVPEKTIPGAVDASLSGTAISKSPAVLWGLAAALVALFTWGAGRTWRRLPAYLVGIPLFLVVLFIFFENFSRLLPANA